MGFNSHGSVYCVPVAQGLAPSTSSGQGLGEVGLCGPAGKWTENQKLPQTTSDEDLKRCTSGKTGLLRGAPGAVPAYTAGHRGRAGDTPKPSAPVRLVTEADGRRRDTGPASSGSPH